MIVPMNKVQEPPDPLRGLSPTHLLMALGQHAVRQREQQAADLAAAQQTDESK
jgi:hypothetical protein